MHMSLFMGEEEMDRDKMIKIIHVWSGRLQICLGCNEFFTGVICTCGNQFYRKATEDDYRRFLLQITGKSSCALMTDQELQLVFKEMIEILDDWGIDLTN